MQFHKAIYAKDWTWYLSIERFTKTALELSDVYKTGFHKWLSDFDVNYSIVLGLNRIVFSLRRKHHYEAQDEKC